MLLLTLGVLAACTQRFNITGEDRQYYAYGKVWRYTTVEHRSTGLELFTTHGFVGPVDRVQQDVVLETAGGEKILVHDRLYALQKDRSYKKINCCDNFSTLANVYAVDGKLFVYFLQRKKNVTDCFVYPAGQPDNEKFPPEKQINWIEFFGEFDPAGGIFHVNSFFAGGIDWAAEMGPNWKQILAKESLADSRKRIYLHRVHFDCDRR